MVDVARTLLAQDLIEYAEGATSAPPPLLERLERDTLASTPFPIMLSGRSVGRFLMLMTSILRPELAVDVGTFTGYSALSIAEALPPTGKVITCEISPNQAAFARRYFDESPHRDKIELRLGSALETLRTIDAPIGLAFIDGEKSEYWEYFEAILARLASTGLIVIDNTLFLGSVLLSDGEAAALPPVMRKNREAVLSFNRRLRADPCVDCCLLTVRDGLTLVRRRS